MRLQNQTFAEDGWSVQIGAFQSEKRAQELAASAFGVLGQTSIHAVTDKKEDLFKAKLTGFTSKKYAFDACQLLKKQAYSCFLVPPAEAQGDK